MMYRILQISPNDSFLLTDAFGNCNEVEGLMFRWPKIAFSFPALEEAGRKAVLYVYDSGKRELVERK